MNRFLFTFSAVLLFCFTAIAQTSSRIIQTTYGIYSATSGKFDYAWDTTRYTYSWGRGGLLNGKVIMYDSCIMRRYSGTYPTVVTYDNSGRPKIRTSSNSIDTNYYTGTQNEPDSTIGYSYSRAYISKYKYNTSKEITEHVRKTTDNPSNIVIDSTYYTYTSGNITKIEAYRFINGIPLGVRSVTTTYNINNQPLIITNQFNYTRLSYTYNLTGNVDMLITEESYSGSFKWDKKHRYTYTSSNDIDVDSIFTWSSSGWQLYAISHHQYDANHNLLIDSTERFNGSSLGNWHKISQTFDANNNKLTRLSEYWDTTNLKWGGDTLNTYTYQTYNPTNIQEQELKPTFKLYPNPSTHFIIADLANVAGIKDYAIYDMTGKLYRRAKVNAGNNTLSIPVADLPNGNYILSFYTDSSTLQQTFVKQ